MSFPGRILQKIRTINELGPYQSLNYLLYQLELRSGWLALTTPAPDTNTSLDEEQLKPNWFMRLPEAEALLELENYPVKDLFKEAVEITHKQYHYFGGEQKPLNLAPLKDPAHWSQYERGALKSPVQDIKYIWEPARFGWATVLGKAYHLSKDEKYAAAFWQFFEEFNTYNPPNLGLNWTSAQEVALRLIALVISAHLFKTSSHSTPPRMQSLCLCVADHAARIPPSIAYAKAQNNNHFISEAVGLYTASLFLSQHAQAAKWAQQGLRWFNQAILGQIAEDGTYVQHSSNYHRMLLMLALWMRFLVQKNHHRLDKHVLSKLAAASEWLAARLDQPSGQVPNLGHNDGSNILPFSSAAYQDYRPIVQAASCAFRAKATLPPGVWDDLCIWLNIPAHARSQSDSLAARQADQLILGDRQSWAALRAVYFTSRPAHADQLHVDIWHKGLNIAMDAGTYQYNAVPPWENALVATAVHNTITINQHDQMTRAGKFLWLDWAQADVEQKSSDMLSAVHLGYTKQGVLHRRTLQRLNSSGWTILDELLPTRQPKTKIKITLNWLLPDWPYQTESDRVILDSPLGKITLRFKTDAAEKTLDIYKAGESLLNGKQEPNLGWISPTYGVKVPALSVQLSIIEKTPSQITSEFYLPE